MKISKKNATITLGDKEKAAWLKRADARDIDRTLREISHASHLLADIESLGIELSAATLRDLRDNPR